MSLQSLVGRSSFITIGIGAGDVATLYTVGRRIGNWLTAASGDEDFLAMLEEDETSILKRRGVIDMINFKKKWGRSLRLFENGVPQKLEGQAVEKLLEISSRFTAMMTCIVAALDEFAAASTVRAILKIFLQRLIPTTEINEDTVVSQLGTRINSWRSAAAVREMNTLCRALRDSFLQQDLIVEGYMPKDEANEVADFLYWVVAGDTEVRYTSSSDVAGIAHCLINLSFEILTVEHFGAPSKCTSACQLVFSVAPFFSEKGKEIANEHALIRRELSTTVSLTQPEETFSTFPISRKVANTCRMAWREGMKSARGMQLALAHNQVRNNLDLIYELRNLTPDDDDNIVRIDAKIVKLVGTTLAFSQFQVAEILEGITSALGKSQRKPWTN